MSLYDSFESLGVDAQRVTFSSFCLLSIVLLLCCVFKPVLFVITGLCVVYAIFLGWQLFKPKKKENGVSS